MPAINPSLIPSITPGQIFKRLTEDTTLNIRWITATDPVLFEAVNRPMADITIRQLIIAKALDQLNLRLSHQAMFPFLINARVTVGSSELDLPISWIWDSHVSVPAKWEHLRLAKIKRMSGTNTGPTGSEYTGVLRLIFSGQEKGSATERSIFYADFQIDSLFTYQIFNVVAVTSTEESNAIEPDETGTISGQIIFRTLDLSDTTVQTFLDGLAPATGATDSDSDGFFDVPTVYEIVDTGVGGSAATNDFLSGALTHGTGELVASAYNSIPPSGADVRSWLAAMNYPFRIGATRASINGITIPAALFSEFDVVVPTQDEPTGDTTNRNSPIWVSHIERLDTLATSLKFVLATNVIQEGGTAHSVDFASFVVERTFTSGRVVAIEPITDLLSAESADSLSFQQGFGTGHVVLSGTWSDTSLIEEFFDDFLSILESPAKATFTKAATILSSYGLSRNSRNTPTTGQAEALRGSTARRETPIQPSDANRYVLEGDQGLGDEIDFRTKVGFPDDLRENPDIDPLGYTGTLLSKKVMLKVDANKTEHDYTVDILPRLRCLFGRDPIFGDIWYDGTLVKFYNGNTWIQL